MIISKILLNTGNETKPMVILILGRKGIKISCILDKYISRKDADKIKANVDRLANFNLQSKILWMKNNINEAYSKGYREFLIKNVKIDKKFSMISNKITK